MAQNADLSLQGMRILIVDDEFLIAITLEETLHDVGAETVTAATLASALKSAAAEPLSAAILDVRLGRDTTEAVANMLSGRGVPFVFYSGQELPSNIRHAHPNVKILAKPTSHSIFVSEILKLAGRGD